MARASPDRNRVFHEPVGPEHHVLGFEIAVDNTSGVSGTQCGRDLDCGVEGLAEGEMMTTEALS